MRPSKVAPALNAAIDAYAARSGVSLKPDHGMLFMFREPQLQAFWMKNTYVALSIAYIAIENVLMKDLRSWRYGLVFGFGLLHGLGFAGVLSPASTTPSPGSTSGLSFGAFRSRSTVSSM